MENNVKAKRRVIAILSTVIALCVIIGIVLLILHIRNNTDGRSLAGTDTTENYLNQPQSTETEAETEALKPEFEISEAGVLTSYNGDDETVVIPDNVISIGAYAFGASPKAEAITTVKLGKSVEDIDVQAFASLTKLENVEVPEENGNFMFTDGVLIKADNSVFFCMPNIIKADYDMFDVFYYVISDKINGEGESDLVSGDMVAKIKREFADPEDPLNRKYYISCNSFTANGKILEVDKSIIHEYKVFNYYKSHYAYITNQCVVYSNRNTQGFGNTWLFTDNEIIRVEVVNAAENREKINGEEWYNYSVINFEAGEDGSLRYTRRPLKYIFYSGYLDYDYYWTGLDEFAKEIGYVKIENGNIVYYPEEKFTARDLGYDEDYVIKYLIKGTDLSVEEYFIQQSQRFESAK